jgi:hypothetical protein
MSDREVMQQALATLEGWNNYSRWVWPESALEQSKQNTTDSIATLKAALEQPQQEPVARLFGTLPVYDTAAQRPWVGLTDTEIDYQAKKDDHGGYFALGALWAEAKLKERNT